LTELFPDYIQGHMTLGSVLTARGNRDGAQTCYETILKLDAEHPEALHFLDVLNARNTNRAPKAYVRRLFNDYARRFDHHLVNTLNYRTPERLRDLLNEILGDKRVGRAVDLGCGTGLMGTHLRGWCDDLVGIDLSEEMIRQAQRKETYDQLRVGDIEEVLPELGQFDLAVAADVVTYLGDLRPVFGCVAESVCSGGLLALSTESSEANQWHLTDSGRYAHHPDYVVSVAESVGWKVALRVSGELRDELSKPVYGDLFVLRR